MTIKAKPENVELTIDLTGSRGNAFVLLGYAKRFAKQLNLDFTAVNAEMTAGDYENLVEVFDGYFGDYVTLYGMMNANFIDNEEFDDRRT